MNTNEIFRVHFAAHLPHYKCACRVRSVYYELQFVEEGEVDLRFNGLEFRITPGHGWLIQPGIEYRYDAAPGFSSWNHRFAVMSGTLFEECGRMNLLPLEPWGGPFARRIDTIIAAGRESSDFRTFAARAAFEEMLLEIDSRRNPRREDFFSAAIRQIGEGRDPGELAAELGMSLRTFFRKFESETGTSPHQYRILKRMELAERYLQSTDLPLKEVSERLGFCDTSHLLRQRKKLRTENGRSASRPDSSVKDAFPRSREYPRR